MAIFNRKRIKSQIIAITGSVGKTSTKEVLYQMLSPIGTTYCNIGNYNGQLGLPITVASTPLDTKYSIYEMGMSFPDEMARIAKIALPDIAVITNIAAVHLENFNSVEEIAQAKAEIFYGMSKNGIVFLNGDNKYTELLRDLAKQNGISKIYTFGNTKHCDNFLLSYKRQGEESILRAKIFGEEIKYKMLAHGEHQALNTVIALAIAKCLSLDLQQASSNLHNFSNIKGRGKIQNICFDGKQLILIDDSYNASPGSVVASLKTMNEIHVDNKASSRKVAILGDMYELGENEEELHKSLLDAIKLNNIDKVITVGRLMKNLFDVLPQTLRIKHFNSYEDVINDIRNFLMDDDYILIKGSHGTKLYEIVKYLENFSAL